MLSEFFREQRALLWQPNRQKQAKIAQISVLCKILRIFSREQYGLISQRIHIWWIFNGSKSVTTATEFKQTSAKIALISVWCKKIQKFWLWIVGFSASAN